MNQTNIEHIQEAHKLAMQKYGDYTEARNALSLVGIAIEAVARRLKAERKDVGLTDIQKEAIKKPCPHCETGKLYEVEGDYTDDETGIHENYLHCDNCLLSMDGSGGYTC